MAIRVIEKRIRGNSWRAIRRKYFAAHPLCVDCLRTGRVSAAQELDHIIPLWAGGKNEERNYQSLCRQCHHEKTLEEQGKAASLKPLANAKHNEKVVIGLDGWPEGFF